ncbi:MAG: SDR family oxidoreductase [Planctomycetota bacterium]|nr:SDR family oxidoreductase [Planctomycetota bacterium]
MSTAGELAGRVALVTGASSGIGRATAETLAAHGAAVAVTGRRPEPLDALVAAISEAGGRAIAIAGDVRDEAHAAEAVARTVAEFGGLTILVNNAGVIGAGPIEDTTTEEWDRILDVDLKGPFFFARAAIPHLKGVEGATILNVSSVTGRRPYPGVGPYCVAKAGVDMLTEVLALELAPHGVRVNAINPGVVVTNLHKATDTVPDYDAFLERCKETHPLGWVGEPVDAAELIAFLVSDRARWITGGLVPLDGGRALTSLR